VETEGIEPSSDKTFQKMTTSLEILKFPKSFKNHKKGLGRANFDSRFKLKNLKTFPTGLCHSVQVGAVAGDTGVTQLLRKPILVAQKWR